MSDDDARRLGMCARCGTIFDLLDGLPAPTLAKIEVERLPGDKEICFPCFLENGAGKNYG